MNKKIIFLDIDGVINIVSSSYMTYMHSRKYIDDLLLRRLEYIISKTDAYIVISSSWRLSMKDLLEQLEIHNFKYLDRIIDRTPFESELSGEYKDLRGYQINHFIENTVLNIGSYIVIDDEIDDITSFINLQYIIKTNVKEGLSDINCDKAILALLD